MAPDPTYAMETPDQLKDNSLEIGETKDEPKTESNSSAVSMPLWGSCRLFVAIILAVVMSTSIASQASMTSAMVCMIDDGVNPYAIRNHRHRSYHHQQRNDDNDDEARIRSKSNQSVLKDLDELMDDGESWKIPWDSKTQGWVVSSFFFGYFFMQVPSGIIVTKLGPKGCMTGGLIVTGILHLVTIPTALWSLPVLYFVRTVAGLACGFMFSGIFALVANWCPRQETSVMFALPCLGFEFGNSFIFLVSLIGCELDYQGGWPVVFYTLGILQIFMGLLMLVAVSDFPTTHRFVSQKEADYITKYRVHDEKAAIIPYGKIMRSVPVWAFLVGQLAIEYAYYTIITQGPVFLRDILRLSHWKINTVSSVPFFVATPTAFIVGYVCDILVAKNIASTTCVRKSNEAISKILVAVSLSILALLPEGEFVGALVLYLVAGIGIQFCYIGFMANPGDLSPAHAGFLAGLGQALTTWVSFVIPVLTGNLASKRTREGWYIIFYIAVGLQVVGIIFFLLFGSGNLQKWAIPEVDENVPIIDKSSNNNGVSKDNDKRQSRYRTLSL